ncbi:hypothetical protein D3C87_152780 [compost metagenome]
MLLTQIHVIRSILDIVHSHGRSVCLIGIIRIGPQGFICSSARLHNFCNPATKGIVQETHYIPVPGHLLQFSISFSPGHICNSLGYILCELPQFVIPVIIQHLCIADIIIYSSPRCFRYIIQTVPWCSSGTVIISQVIHQIHRSIALQGFHISVPVIAVGTAVAIRCRNIVPCLCCSVCYTGIKVCFHGSEPVQLIVMIACSQCGIALNSCGREADISIEQIG